MSRFDYDPLIDPTPAPVSAVTRRQAITAETFGTGARLAIRSPLTGPRRSTHQDRLVQSVPAPAPMPETRPDRERRESLNGMRALLYGLPAAAALWGAIAAIGYGVALLVGGAR